ncbi:hypothetical protein [Polycladomyces subterraneus]|uniref:Uncharacterized protein n=1 Tax=Polycladomyces subterraneus TaxID=1016997 RepID=A0ABT8IQX3_9BACL|nr:hypothetical protein [Polycladomyces subterraneus]MDN4595206.1 hypothetical protein [Polycladomyces subterraneus]
MDSIERENDYVDWDDRQYDRLVSVALEFRLKSEGCGVIKPGDQGNKKGTKELNTIEYPLILNNDGKDRPRPIFVESLFLKPLYED